MNTAIDVKQLSVTLGNRHILHDINVSVPIGKITTFMRAMNISDHRS